MRDIVFRGMRNSINQLSYRDIEVENPFKEITREDVKKILEEEREQEENAKKEK